jgi:molybdate transport system substrate-binding protein
MRNRVLPLLLLALLTCAIGARAQLRVAAAANLTRPFQQIGALFTRHSGVKVTFVFGATVQLAKQIENGAPYDLFAAADEKTIAGLEKKGLIAPASRFVYAQGRLALWARPSGEPCPRRIEELASAKWARIGVANPDLAPYGAAAVEALQRAGIWDAVRPRLVYGENIQQAFQFAQSGNADVSFVALSQTVGAGQNFVLVPEGLYSPIRQAVAMVKSTGNHEQGARFLAFLKGPEAAQVLRSFGYLVPTAR